jgi:hypothetical protein
MPPLGVVILREVAGSTPANDAVPRVDSATARGMTMQDCARNDDARRVRNDDEGLRAQ